MRRAANGRRGGIAFSPVVVSNGTGGDKLVNVSFLQTLSLFKDVPESELALVIPIISERRYTKGAFIFHQGDPGDVIYFVKEGRVRIAKTSAGGQEHVLAIWPVGSAVGLVVLADDMPYPATASADEDTVLLAIRVRDLHRVLPHAGALSANALRLVGRRLRIAFDISHDLAVYSTHGRIASLLLKKAEEVGSDRFDLGLTHSDIAGLVGTSRETVTRVLSDFRRTGCIRAGGGEIVIVDEDGLRRHLEEA